MKRNLIVLTVVTCIALPVIAAEKKNKSEPLTATADFVDPSGKKVGTAMLLQTSIGVRVSVQAKDLAPGTHAIHFHEKGVCQGPDFKSAGGHFNPEHKEHGIKNPKGHHAGDLDNIRVEANGAVKAVVLATDVTLEQGKPNSLIRPDGTSLIIHEKADDMESQPAGNAGNRVVCGVIQATQK